MSYFTDDAKPKGGIGKENILRRLKALHSSGDPEAAHSEADDLLIAYINDSEIEAAFLEVPKWYA